MAGAVNLTPNDYRVHTAIKAVNRRTGRPARMTAIRGELHFGVSISEVRRAIWRLEDAGMAYRLSERTGYYTGQRPDGAWQRPPPVPRWAKHLPATHQMELRLPVDMGRYTDTPTKPAPPRRQRPVTGDGPRQMALPIADAAA